MGRREVSAEELATPLVPYDEARALVIGAFDPLPPVEVPLVEAMGLRVAEPVVASLDVPGFDSSAMDGYAVRAADSEGASPTNTVLLAAIDGGSAGTAVGAAVEPGTAVKVMTGAPIPPGGDAVVPWEDTMPSGDKIGLHGEVAPRRHIRPRGDDVRQGQVVAEAGERVRPAHVGVLASIGCSSVRAHPAPRVAVVATGSELVAPGGTLGPAQIYDSNTALLRALCQAAGAEVVAAEVVTDDPELLADRLTRLAATVDLLVTSGGASVGEHDWLRRVLESEGELTLWRVAMRPGKPVAFGRVGSTPVLCLPGNPGSAFACAHAFVAPAIRALSGHPPEPDGITARLVKGVTGDPKRTVLCPVLVDGSSATPLAVRSSSLAHLRGCDGMAIVPPGGLPAGAGVRVEWVP